MSNSRKAFLADLSLHVRARYPVLYLVTWEEDRVEEMIVEAATGLGKGAYLWTSTEGMRLLVEAPAAARKGAPVTAATAEDPGARKPLSALQRIADSQENALFVLKDLHAHLDDAAVVRRLRDLISSLKRSYKTLLLVSPIAKVPDELEKDVVMIEVPLPDESELGEVLDRLIKSVQPDARFQVALDADLRERMLKAARGLTASQAQQAFCKALVKDRKFAIDDLEILLSEKRQVIRRTGVLEYYDLDESFSHVGGLDLLKEWLESRQGAFSEKARAYGLPEPKGLLLLGVQGCGKSLCAKSIASLWKMPLLRLDVGSVFSMYVGSSEERMRRAIRLAETLAPVVLWVDELDKGFAGLRGGGGDSGITQRVFGTFLTWMQEKQQPVFVVATANSIQDMPPELLRKGRFDEIFFVDLPSAEERAEIFRIHLSRRRRDAKGYDVDRLAASCEGFSGAEIEQAVIAAMYRAFGAGRDFTTEDVVLSVGETVPLSRTMREEIDALREWATERARPAARP